MKTIILIALIASIALAQQECVDALAQLEPGTITETLTFPLNTDENEYYHHYRVEFNDFNYIGSCFSATVYIASVKYDHSVTDNGITITFPWKDAEANGCTQVSDTEQQCQFVLSINLQNTGVLQHKKLFTSIVTTPDLQNLSQELTLNVINDEDESLKSFDQTLDTQLKFCADLQCSSYTTPSEIIRNTDVYVEFKINTPGYSNYFPIHDRFTLNEFQVDIQNQAAIDSWAEQGRIIYHFRPPFAANNIVLAIGISLSKTNPNRRRFLQEEAQKDNVGTYMRITVLEEGDLKKENDNEMKEESDNTALIVGLIAGGVVLVVALVGLGVYYKLKTQKQSGDNYREAPKASSNDGLSNQDKQEQQLAA